MNAPWLNDNEMRGWRAFVENYGLVMAALEADLVPTGLTLGDYQVLVLLSERPHHRARMCDLSDQLGLSPSGLTRRLDGLVRVGYVSRTPSQSDRRVIHARLTQPGMDALERAVPLHVRSVRRHLVDRLTPEQLTSLGDIFSTVGDALRHPVAESAADSAQNSSSIVA